MAYEQEREKIAQIVDRHAKVPVVPNYSADIARKIEQRAKVLKIQTPLVVHRFLDRLVDHDSDGVSNKLSRDLHGKEFADLTPDKQAAIHRMHNDLPGWNPATGSTYAKAGMDFAQAHNLLLASYSENSSKLPQEMLAYMNDLSHGLEHDLDDAAKKAGFYKEYSDSNMALRVATAGPHKLNQSTPIVTQRR